MQTFDETAWYTIAAKCGGKVIEVENASDENGAAVCLADASGSDQQMWSIRHINGKYFKIINKHSNKALDIISIGVVNGANLHQWEQVDGDSQIWFFEEKADGTAVIKSALSAKCIDVVGMNAEAAGARLQIWDDVNGDNQSWLIQPAEAAAAVEEPVIAAEEPVVIPAEEQPAQPAAVTEEQPKGKKILGKKAAAKKTAAAADKPKRTRKAAKKAVSDVPAKPKTRRGRKSKAEKEAEALAASAAAAFKASEQIN